MPTTFEKLNLKSQSEIVILNAPASFEPEIASLSGVSILREPGAEIHFALAFVTRQDEVDTLAAALLPRLQGDAILWFAYPKQTSKKFKCDFNRDTGWAALFSAGWDTVRAVAIDQDWSALRFRRSEFIQSR
jgi:hypothetical protein